MFWSSVLLISVFALLCVIRLIKSVSRVHDKVVVEHILHEMVDNRGFSKWKPLHSSIRVRGDIYCEFFQDSVTKATKWAVTERGSRLRLPICRETHLGFMHGHLVRRDLNAVLTQMARETAQSVGKYHLLNSNCHAFAEKLADALCGQKIDRSTHFVGDCVNHLLWPFF